MTFSPSLSLAERDLRQAITEQMALFFRGITGPLKIAGSSADFLDALESYLLNTGSMHRPLLFLQSYCHTGGKEPETLIPAAAALEMLHTFALIHDDLADKALERRGSPALHRRLKNPSLAMTAGDLLHCAALDLFMSAPLDAGRKHRALNMILRTSTLTCLGQTLDMTVRADELVKISRYQLLRMLDLKTGLYSFACPLCCGAILAGAGDKELMTLFRRGIALGRAYQIRDDLSEIPGYGPSDRPDTIWEDLRLGRPTLAFWYGLGLTSGKSREQLLHWLNVDQAPWHEAEAGAAEILRHCGALEKCEQEAENFQRRGKG